MTTDADALSHYVALIERDLDARLPKSAAPGVLSAQLVDAMRYAALGGGKRIRPLLTCATAASLGTDPTQALAPACAVEFIHTYSLIHDDLPAMDDDALRRGRPTVHVAYGEAMAVLAGDALQALAFETLTSAPILSAEVRLTMIGVLAAAAGWQGMVGGQAFDMAATGCTLSIDALQQMHRAKTGALLTAAVELGALTAGAGDATRTALRDFGSLLGLAFQIVDDLLDVTESTQQIGKVAGADAAAGKNTFPGLLGIDASRMRARHLHDDAVAALRRAGIDSGPLHAIARQIVERTR